MVNHRRHLLVASLLVVATTFVAYLLLTRMFALPPQGTHESVHIDYLFEGHWWAIAFLFSLVVVFMLYSVVIFRRKDGDTGSGEYMHGNTRLEIAWTLAPLSLVVAFGWWGAALLNDITSPAEDANAWTVEVRGYKWAWEFTYEDGTTLGALVVPVDQPVLLKMTASDVLHSFWVPEYRVKQDLVPGLTTYVRFTPSKTTTELEAERNELTGIDDYQVRVLCAEICGTRHAYMVANVYALESLDAVRARIAELSALPTDPVARGEFWSNEVFGCAACHSIDGSTENYAGPTWQGIWGREEQLADGTSVIVDEAYVTESIYQPNAKIVAGYAPNIMPQNYEQQFADTTAQYAAQGFEVDIVAEIIAYMQTLTAEQ